MKKKLKKIYKKMRAFTLVEVMIVMVLLSVLMMAAYTNVSSQMKKGRDARRKMDLDTAKNKLEEFYYDKKLYPSDFLCDKTLILGKEILLNNIPCDPKTWTSYAYVSGADLGGWYKVYAKLENTSDKIIDTLGCRNGCGPGCSYNYGVASPNVDLDKCTPTPMPSSTPAPTLPSIYYACSPGGGQTGLCEAFDDPVRSQCPIVFPNDPTCQNKCRVPVNRCKNSSGKHVPS